jgi:hypothetical protein
MNMNSIRPLEIRLSPAYYNYNKQKNDDNGPSLALRGAIFDFLIGPGPGEDPGK